MTITLAEDMVRSTTDIGDGAMARTPVLFFGLELPDTIVYKCSTAFVDFNLLFYLFINSHANMNK